MNKPLERLKHHVSGAIERGEAKAIEEIPALYFVCSNSSSRFIVAATNNKDATRKAKARNGRVIGLMNGTGKY